MNNRITKLSVLLIATLAVSAILSGCSRPMPAIHGEPTPELIAEFNEYAERGEDEWQAAFDALEREFGDTHLIRYQVEPPRGFVLFPR